MPIIAGAVLGLLTGLVGMFATVNLSGSPVGGLVGAVGCGITTVYLSREGLLQAFWIVRAARTHPNEFLF